MYCLCKSTSEDRMSIKAPPTSRSISKTASVTPMFRSVAFTLCLLSPNCIEACARLLYLSSHISVPKNPLKIDNASSEKATFRQIASRLAKGCFGLRTVRHDFNASGGLKLFFLLFRILWSSFGTVTSDVYGKGVQPSRTTIHVTLQHLSEICSHRHHS